MLHVVGTVLEVSTRWAGNPGNQFEQITANILTGKSDIERVRLGRDFQQVPEGREPQPGKYAIPREGDEVVFEVGASAYSGRNGAGLQLTAYRDVTDRLAALIPSA